MATDLEKVRLLIADFTAPYHFTDDQINIFLDMADNSVNLAAAIALESWASSYSASVDSEKIGDYSYTQKIINNMLDLAKRLRDGDASSPYLTWAEMDLTGEDE